MLTDEQKELCRRLREDLVIADADAIAAADLIELLAAHSAGAQDRADDAFEAWKNDPRFYQWNTTDEHAALNFSAGWNAHSVAHPQPMAQAQPVYDKSVVCRLATQWGMIPEDMTAAAARDTKRWREKIIQAMRAPSRGDFTVALNAVLREMTAAIKRGERESGK